MYHANLFFQNPGNDVEGYVSYEELEEISFEKDYAVAEVLANLPEAEREMFDTILAVVQYHLSLGEEAGVINESGAPYGDRVEEFCTQLVNIPEWLEPLELIGAIARGVAHVLIGDDFPDCNSRLKAVYERIAKWGFKDEAERVLELEEGLVPRFKQEILSAIRTCKEQCHLC